MGRDATGFCWAWRFVRVELLASPDLAGDTSDQSGINGLAYAASLSDLEIPEVRLYAEDAHGAIMRRGFEAKQGESEMQ